MGKFIIKEVTLEMILVIAIVLLLVFLVKIYLSIHTEKRVSPFAMANESLNIVSFTDIIINTFVKLIKFSSKLLSKLVTMKHYAARFDKRLILSEDAYFNSMDYVSFKFYVMFLIQILYIISVAIKVSVFNPYVFLLVSVISFFFVDILIIFVFSRKKKVMEDQLLQAIVIMNNAFKSGKNITQAVNIVQKELPNPIKKEFEIVAKDISYGLDLTVVFSRFANRIKINEAKYITSSLSLLNKTGGNIVTVFNMIERTFYDRLKINNELKSLTAASRFLYHILTYLPFIFIIVIVFFSPDYFMPLISTPVGFIIDGLILVLYITYMVLIKKAMKVDEV